MIKNVCIYGLDESVRASKYPMSMNTERCKDDITVTTMHLAQSDIGSGHDQFLTGIIVQFDLTFSIKAWTEAERYHFFDFVSSQSTMHKIANMDIDEQCNEYVSQETKRILKMLVEAYRSEPSTENYLKILYNVPTGFKLTARMTTNYRQFKTIYKQRKNHTLPEWHDFCKWIETLPHSEFIVGGDSTSKD